MDRTTPEGTFTDAGVRGLTLDPYTGNVLSCGASWVLEVLEKQHGLHGALKAGFSALYGYTSDANGIRHALMEASNLQVEDAVYMLVACSAFVSYLVAKAARLGIPLK